MSDLFEARGNKVYLTYRSFWRRGKVLCVVPVSFHTHAERDAKSAAQDIAEAMNAMFAEED